VPLMGGASHDRARSSQPTDFHLPEDPSPGGGLWSQ
jgi:hypothetical protein